MRFFSSRLLLAAVVVAGQTLAHHSAVVFDVGETLERTGKVTLFTLRNPHLILNMEVTNAEGETELWRMEGQGISEMQAMGFDRGSVKEGDEITVRLNPLKSGQPGGLVLGLIGADGRAYNMEPAETEVALVYPALMEYVPPPAGETWQQREQKTRPSQLPIVSQGLGPGETPGADIPGALDPDNLAKPRPAAPFDLTGLWQFRGEDEYRANYGSFEFKPMPELTAKGKANIFISKGLPLNNWKPMALVMWWRR